MRAALAALIVLLAAPATEARVASYGGTVFPVPPPHDVQATKSVALRSTYPHNPIAQNVTVGGTYRQFFEASATGTIYAISVCYQNISSDPSTTEADGLGPMDGVTATLETSSGGAGIYPLSQIVKIRQFIFDGQLAMANPAINGGVICSKMLPTELKPGQGFYIRTYAPPGRAYASWQGLSGQNTEYANNGVFSAIVNGAVGDGATTTFTGVISQAGMALNSSLNVVLPLVPRTLHMTAGTLILDDDGAGGWVGNGTGTVDYVTGAFSVTAAVAPGNGATFVVSGYGRAGTPAPDDTNVTLPAGFIQPLFVSYVPQYLPTLAPVAILGQVDAAAPPQHTLCVVGDSIVSAIGNAPIDKAYPEYMSNNLGIIRVGQGGETAAQFAVNNFRRMKVLTGRCDKVYVNYGSNDVTHQDPLATIQANLLSTWSQLAAILPNGINGITQQTITPYTTSNVVNTPISAGWLVVRNQLNAWICTQIGVTIGAIVDVNEVLENTPGSCAGNGDGLWKSLSYTSDGRHWSIQAQRTLIPGVYGPSGTNPAPVFAP
jgi:hypothetical protein